LNLVKTFLFWLFLLIPIFGIAQEEANKRSISLSWEEIPDSTGYDIELVRVLPDGKKRPPIVFKSKSSNWSGKIVPGTYEMRLRAIDDRDVAGDWSDSSQVVVRILPVKRTSPKHQVEIKTKEEKEFEMDFSWEPVPDAVLYRVEVFNAKGESISKVEVPETSAKISLPVGQKLSWKVIGISKEASEGEDSGDKGEMTLIGRSLVPPIIEKPETKFVTQMSWTPPEFANKFDYVLSRKLKNGKWTVMDKKSGVEATNVVLDPKKPGGLYRLQVKAYGLNREASTTSKLEFPVYEGQRTPAAIETAKLREAMEQDLDNYFIATYLLTTLKYSGQNREYNSTAEYDSLSGSGRLGYGYMPKGKWGFTATLDMAGVIINSKNYIFTSSEVQAVWRRYLGQATQLRLFGGWFTKEIPEARGFQGAPVTISNIHQTGPMTGFQLWHSLTYDLGIQVNASANLAVLKLATPSGGAIDPTLSHQLGLLFSYRIKRTMTGFAGVAQRTDKASYKAKPYSGGSEANYANAGDKNEVSMIGTYLNLYLEWGF